MSSTVYIFVAVFNTKYITQNDKDSISSLVTGLFLVGLIGVHFLNIFQSLLSHKEQHCIYQTFDEIDYIFQHQLLVNVRYQNIRRYLWQKFITIVIILIIIKIISIYYSGDHFEYSVYTAISIAMLQMRCLQAIYYADLINSKLEHLNAHIPYVVVRTVAEEISCISITEYRNHKSTNGNGADENQFICDQILAMKQIYGQFIIMLN